MAASYICPSLLGLLVLLLLASCRAEKVAIIGGGVGGAAAAYYLHKADDRTEIHIFERENRLGGRIQETTFEGRAIELGGAVLNKKNKLSVSLVEELGLETAVPQGLNGSYGIFDGESIVYREGANDTNRDDWRRFFKYFFRYTLNIRSMKSHVKTYLEDWEKLLDDPPFEDVLDLLDMLNMVDKVGYTLATDLADFIGFYTLRDYAGAATRSVLGQNPPLVNSVAGHQALTVSRACRTDQLWSIKGGAQTLVDKLVEESQASVHLGHDVFEIEKPVAGGYKVHYKTGGQRSADAFDVVFISAPIDSDELKLPDGVDAGPELEWLDEEVILIKGKLNETFFRLKANESLPDVIGTTDNDYFPIQAIRRLWTFADGDHAYIVTMAEPMTEQMVSDIFSSVSKIERKTIENAWPDLTAKGRAAKYPPIQLDGEKLLYPSAVESIVSGLEPTIVSARNAVRLLLEPREGFKLGAAIEESVVAVEEATERVNVGTVPDHVLDGKARAETAEVGSSDTVDRSEL